MEMEAATSSEAMSKKVWKIVRAVLIMIKKGLAKSRLLVDLTVLLKHRTHKLAGKAFHSLLLAGVSSPCASPIQLDYEFSCTTGSPGFFPKRSKSLLHLSSPCRDEAATMAAVQRVLEMINAADVEAADQSPVAVGCRQLRITDSPFPLKGAEEETVQVNRAADAFINKFYRDMWMQKSATPLDSPYHDASSS